jgi:GNAT superfamily N-acetyltransferase
VFSEATNKREVKTFLKNCNEKYGDFSSENDSDCVWIGSGEFANTAFCFFYRDWESSIINESRWGLKWATGRSLENLRKAMNHLPEIFKKIGAVSVAVRIPMSDHSFVQVLEAGGFCYVGGLVTLRMDRQKRNTPQRTVGVSIRKVQKNDVGQLEKVARTAFTEGRFYHEPGLKTGSAQKIYGIWAKNSVNYADEIWVAEKKIQSGFVSLKKDHKGKRLWIDLIAVAPHAQGLGIGGLLVEESIKRVSLQKDWDLAVKTEPENLKALRFYLKNGFELESFQLDYVWRQRGSP